MKRLFFFLAAAMMAAGVMAQIDSQFYDVNHNTDSLVRYKLYPTLNMAIFLKLDTRTGAIYQVTISNKAEARSAEQSYLGIPDKTEEETDTINGRYELYPTQYLQTFILIDQVDGDIYEVKWHKEKKHRTIAQIHL